MEIKEKEKINSRLKAFIVICIIWALCCLTTISYSLLKIQSELNEIDNDIYKISREMYYESL